MDDNQFEGAARNFAGQAQQTVGDMVGDGKMQADGIARQAAGKAQQAYGDARSQVQSLASDLSHSVEQQPLMALAIVGAIGFLLGAVTTRR